MGVPVNANQIIPISNIWSLAYTSDAAFLGQDSFMWNASDGFSYATNPPIKVVEPTITIGAAYNDPGTGFYTRKDEVCLIGVNEVDDKGINLDCVTTASLASVAKEVIPFGAVYMAYEQKNYDIPKPPTDDFGSFNGNNNLYSDPYFASPAIRDSKTAGYKYALVGMGDAADFNSPGVTSYFYTNAQGTNWQYLTASQEGIQCSGLHTADAQKAFVGVCATVGP